MQHVLAMGAARERYSRTRGSSRDAKNEHPGSKRRHSPVFPEWESVNLSSLTVQESLTDPLDLLGRRLRIRHQKLNHAVQRPFPAPKRSHALVYLGQRSEGGGDIARDGQCVVV